MNQMTSINDQKTENQKQSIKAKQNESNGIGSAGFVFALISIFIAWITFLGWIIWLLGFSLSWAGIYKKRNKLAIAGLVISILVLIFYIVFFSFIIFVFNLIIESDFPIRKLFSYNDNLMF